MRIGEEQEELEILPAEEDQPMVVLRMPGVGLLYYPAALAGSLVTRRRRLRVSERINRWVYDAR